jgi:hypothetical protein
MPNIPGVSCHTFAFIMHQQNIHEANYKLHFDIIHRVLMLMFIFLCSTVLHKLSEFIIIAASHVGDT